MKKKIIIIEKPKNFPVVKRNQLILQSMSNKSFLVHNGKNYVLVFVTPSKLGTKFGEYALTRKICIHHSKKKKKK